jgi:6-phosphogluconolactonase (cycloisomerase 2 family)
VYKQKQSFKTRGLLKNNNRFQKTSKFLTNFVVLILGFAPLLLSGAAHASAPYTASNVLGEPDFTSTNTGCNTTTQNLLCASRATAYDPTRHLLFVSDAGGNRIVVYDLSSGITNGMKALYVLGQPDFSSNSANLTQNGLSSPEALVYDQAQNELFVADHNNGRVLIYQLGNGITNGMNASYVLGEPDFTTNNSCIDNQQSFCRPQGLALDSTKKLLFISEGSARILVFDLSAGISNNMSATNVLGQPDFTTTTQHCAQNGNSTFCEVWGMDYDNIHNRLFVVDNEDNDRVLVFNLSAGITNGMSASWELGSPDFNTDICTTSGGNLATPSSLCEAWGVVYDPINDRLFATDSQQRILVFDTKNLTSGENAGAIIGQPDFTTPGNISNPPATNSNFDDINGFPAYDPTSGRLFIPDLSYNRVMVFDLVHIQSTSLTNGSVGGSFNQTVNVGGIQGAQSFSITSGSLPPGLSLGSSSGVISGTPTTTGSFTFTVTASDSNGTAGILTDSESFTIVIAPKAPNTGTILGITKPLAGAVITVLATLTLLTVARLIKKPEA